MAHHRSSPAGTPLYVHLPFCVHKCPYCDFFSVEGRGQDLDGFVDALLLELEARAPEVPRTIFFGGGTPSFLSEAQLVRLFEALETRTGFRGTSEEVTVECNPESLDEPKARLLKDLGVTRLSIGVQSLDPETLRFFERPHGPEQALEAYRVARAAGFSQVSVDLIHGAPTEDPSTLERNVLSIIDLKPNHISAYGLTYEPGTPLHARLERGAVEPVDEDRELANLHLVHDLLTASGLEAYEVSNYALPGSACRHNLNYWLNGPYVGLGPSAASHLEGTRSGNPRSLARWQASLERDPLAAAYEEHLEPRARLGETWWLGLRLAAGVDPARARATAGWQDSADPALTQALELVSQDLLEEVDGHLRLTPRGRPLADHVGRQFLVESPDA